MSDDTVGSAVKMRRYAQRGEAAMLMSSTALSMRCLSSELLPSERIHCLRHYAPVFVYMRRTLKPIRCPFCFTGKVRERMPFLWWSFYV